jgi:hypothetical protein
MIETKIEIGKRSKTKMTYADAVFYCFCLGDGWRLPNEEENEKEYANRRLKGFPMCWYLNDPVRLDETKWYVTPVRDLKDD